ncbi:hypothetical protein TRFO_38656 [Tritrichomonas foetus]|uniref:Mitochondrial import inner membrane translocase subunit Tim17 family protein n=1 Tax=Tritrichomonas foetus TaxID=1144522 RepID=A0A1J4J7A5_9EUKA|nr:hypothetical protein TRFO_38656 [Tritrichomonas foetus]|eukprot:OHS95110.1 hypothetical protein TRFO_38656 [Tritrichomonas foetus]
MLNFFTFRINLSSYEIQNSFYMSSNKLTKDQLSEIVKMQLIYEKNTDVRPVTEMAKDLPFKMIKNVGITTTLGSALTFGSSVYSFRRLDIATKDVKTALPFLTSFSCIDFGINYTLTKATGRKAPDRWISVTSSAAAGATVGYVFGNRRARPTIAGGVIGMAYGYLRNTPLQLFGIEPF